MELWPPPPARAPPLDRWGWGGRSGPGRLRLRGARGGAGSLKPRGLKRGGLEDSCGRRASRGLRTWEGRCEGGEQRERRRGEGRGSDGVGEP